MIARRGMRGKQAVTRSGERRRGVHLHGTRRPFLSCRCCACACDISPNFVHYRRRCRRRCRCRCRCRHHRPVLHCVLCCALYPAALSHLLRACAPAHFARHRQIRVLLPTCLPASSPRALLHLAASLLLAPPRLEEEIRDGKDAERHGSDNVDRHTGIGGGSDLSAVRLLQLGDLCTQSLDFCLQLRV